MAIKRMHDKGICDIFVHIFVIITKVRQFWKKKVFGSDAKRHSKCKEYTKKLQILACHYVKPVLESAGCWVVQIT